VSDVVKIGDVTLYQGDCRDILPTLPKVDAVITDPPYGIGYGYLNYEDSQENLKRLVDFFVPHCISIADRVAVFCGVNNLQIYPIANWTMAWHWKGTNVYGKYGINQWQPIICYGKDIKGFGSINGQIKSDAIYYEGGNCDEIKKFDGHPCPKNLGIMLKVIARLSIESQTILDPFMGSGTTGVAAIQLGRSFIGIEREPKYFDIACKRIEQAVGQGKLFQHEKPAEPVQESFL
jgi:site-specific DNA-methyltransferase (adenine-specific)/modification methylase